MIKTRDAGQKDGKKLYWYDFENLTGMQMTVTNLGATITSIMVPDKNGEYDDVALGFDTIEEYIAEHPHMGSTAGRYANRIADGRFRLGDVTYQLKCNNGKNHLHGGPEGFYRKVWDGTIDGDTLVLTYISPDGEEQYPGELKATVKIRLTDNNEIDIQYTAVADADTAVNLTNHTYFNLNGAKDTILEHCLTVNADFYTETDDGLIPTGKLIPVENTPLDFRTERKIGERIFEDDYESVRICNGYDNNFVLNGVGMREVAEVKEMSSGRVMKVWTDQPGMQVYTAQSLEDGMNGKGGRIYAPFYGVCLETQVFPDAVNHENFAGGILKKGDVYTHHAKYAFSITEK